MTIKLIIFDLDGVLVSSRDDHYKAFNQAIEEVVGKEFIIPYEEHLAIYDGLSTTKKLKLLTKNKNLDTQKYNDIWKTKQEKTFQIIDGYRYDERIRQILSDLKKDGYLIYVASNCIWKSVKQILLRKGFMEYIDYFMSNEDVKEPKPSPEIYWKAIIRSGKNQSETMILEDSHIGREAALLSGAYLMPINDPSDVKYKDIKKYIMSKTEKNIDTTWKGKCNVIIPMAGKGSRFSIAGYTFPKPLIDVKGKPMIQLVIESLQIDPINSKYIYIVQKDHYEKYNLKHLLNLLTPNCEIVQIDTITEGAACTCLLAEPYLDPDLPVLLANSDQYIEWDANEFMYSMESDGIDGGLLCFESTHPKFSFAKVGENGFVTEVAEKKVISNMASTGIYYFKKGSEFLKYTKQMIEKNIRVKNEFYVCPIYNQFIEDGKNIKVMKCKRMVCLGTPEDLEQFLRNN
jgi:HAD superfamily hydrolase (TIGR01509 family)